MSRAVGILILFVTYFLTARFGLKLGAVSGFATLIWPPSGISLAALLIFGQRLWPGVALGAFFVNWSTGAPFPAALGVGVGNTIEAVLGATLLRRIGFQNSLERLKDVVGLIFFAALFSTFVSATIGTASLLVGGAITPIAYRTTWLAWWYGDMMGNLVIAPVLLVWSTGLKIDKRPWRIVEAVALMTLIVLGGFVLFSDWIVAGDSRFLRPFFIFPILMLVAVRLGQKGVVTAMLAVSVIALGATAAGHGRFWTGSLSESLLQAQIFLAVVAISEMVLASTIMERQRERDALRASNAQREAILNSSLDSIVTMNHEGRVVEFNPAAEKTFGYKREDAIGKEMASLIIPPRLRQAHRKGLAHYRMTHVGPVLGKRLELPAVRSDGTEFPTELSIVPIKTAGAALFTGFIQDITEKKRTEEIERFLAETSETLSSSIDYKTTLKHVAQAPVPRFADWCIVHILDEETQHFQTIEWACAVRDKESLLQEYIARYLSNLSKPTIISRVFKTKQPRLVKDAFDEYYRSIVKDEEQLLLLMSLGAKSLVATPLFLRGKALGVISIASIRRHYDPTDTAMMEEFARRAAIALENARLYHESQEAIYARDEFLSIASHELKTPLTSLSLQLQMFNRSLQRSLAVQGKGLESAEAVSIPMRTAKSIGGVEVQSRRLTALLDELLDLTRIRLGRLHLEREDVDLSTVVRETQERFKAEAMQKGIAISVRAETSTIGSWDRVRTEQIVSNLLSNAIKYGERRPVSIVVEKDTSRHRARLIVQDHGMGVPPEMQESIFQRFERGGISGKKIAGLGLGLYITRQIVEAHGGTISVESEVGKGSTFTVDLPLDVPQEQTLKKASSG